MGSICKCEKRKYNFDEDEKSIGDLPNSDSGENMFKLKIWKNQLLNKSNGENEIYNLIRTNDNSVTVNVCLKIK
jgi:hypothetical protein